MTEDRRNYNLTATVRFNISDDVDPLYWVNEEGVKQWRMEGIYDIPTEQGVYEHLAYNCLVNDVDDASRLDGWGDLDAGKFTMHPLYGSIEIEES